MIKLRGRTGLKYRLLPLIRFGFAIVGKRWTDFYAWLLNYQERSTRMADVIKRYSRDLKTTSRTERGLYDISVGRLYVDFLKQHGLRPNHDVLDFGCGYGRVAIPLLRYLEPGKYVGIDLSSERIRMAHEYVEFEKLKDAQPAFYVAQRDNGFSYLGGRKFDFVWARAVLGHMPLDDVRVCLAGLRLLLKPQGVFIGDYDTTVQASDEIQKTNVKTFQVPERLMRKVVAETGFEYAEISDWENHISPDEPRPYIRMMLLQPKLAP